MISIRDLLARVAARGSTPVLGQRHVGGELALSGADLAFRIERLASTFGNLGLRPGDRVALWADNSPNWVVVDLAAARAGLVLVPVFPALSADEAVEWILVGEARACFVSGRDRLLELERRRYQMPLVGHLVALDGETIGGVSTGSGETSTVPEAVAAADQATADLIALQLSRDPTGTLRSAAWTRNRWAGSLEALGAVIDTVPVETVPSQRFFCCRSLAGVEERQLCHAALARGFQVVFPRSTAVALEDLRLAESELLSLEFSHFSHLMNWVFGEVQRHGPRRQKLFQQAVQVGREALRHRFAGEVLPAELERRWKAADRWAFSEIRRYLGGRARCVLSTGTPLTQGWLTFFWAAGVPVFEGYTTDEAGWISCNTHDSKRLETAGPLLPGVELGIEKNGEIRVRRRKEAGGGHWIGTGDLGSVDEDGFLTVEGSRSSAWRIGKTRLSPSRIARAFAANHWIEHVLVARGVDDTPMALVIPDFPALAKLAKAHGLEATTPEQLCAAPKVLGFLDYQVKSINETLPEPERLKGWEYLARELEASELTSRGLPRLEVLRSVSEEFAGKLAPRIGE